MSAQPFVNDFALFVNQRQALLKDLCRFVVQLQHFLTVTHVVGRHLRAEGAIFDGYRTLLPLYDMAVAALVGDPHDRGLDEGVVVWGEFGRPPRVNKTGGRDHWPAAGCALVAGGGLKVGQYVGGAALDARVRPAERAGHTVPRARHRPGVRRPRRLGGPMYLLDDVEPIRELL